MNERSHQVWYFTHYEELVHTEDELHDLLKARAQDNLYLGREQDTLTPGHWPYGWGTLRAAVPAHPTRTAVPASYVAGQAYDRFARGVKEDIGSKGKRVIVHPFPQMM